MTQALQKLAWFPYGLHFTILAEVLVRWLAGSSSIAAKLAESFSLLKVAVNQSINQPQVAHSDKTL